MRQRKFILWGLCLYLLYAAYYCSLAYAMTLAHIYPLNEREDISYLSSRDKLCYSDSEYRLLFEQTGLGRAAIEKLSSPSELKKYQDIFYGEADFESIQNSPVSYEEYVPDPKLVFADIEDGDILITNSSHVFSWRNGHSAIVTDAEKGLTVEAVVIGTYSSVQHISKWEHYPNVRVMRLKNADAEERRAIAKTAADNLADRPYNLFVGIIPPKYDDIGVVRGTQCAHLVWSAYAAHGYDIDSDRGLIVTPKNISESELLETVQIYGAV